MSGKKFVEKVQSEGAGGIFGQQGISELQQTVQENKQRAEQPRPVDVSDTTIDQLGNTDAQATDTGIIGKVKAKIAGKIMEKAGVPIATNLVKEQLKQDKYKSIVGESSADEKVELGQKVANLQGVGQEYAQQQQEQRQKSLESLQKMALPSAKSIFKDYWQSVDGDTTYLTNGKSILTQPTIQTIDWNSKLGQAYDTVGDVLQRENRLLSIEEFRSYFPEYDHIDDDTINFFMGGVANDVINRHQKTDIQTVANVMGSMSMVDGYTMKFDSALDLFTDDLFVKYGIPESAWNDPQQKEWIDAMDTLKTYADWLNQRGANMYGYSEYTVLQSYRNQVPEIDEALKILEKHSNKETNKWMEKYMSEYKTNIANMEVEIEAGASWQNILNEVNKDLNETIAGYIDNFVTNRAESIAATTQEYGTQNLRLIRRILYGNYYKDDNGNYYDLTGELMAYTKDGETYTPDGKKINMNNYRIGLIRAWTNSLLGVSEGVTEFMADLKKGFVGGETGVSEDLLRQYASEIVGDIIKTSFTAVMTATPTGLAYQTISQIPGGPGFAMEKYFQVLSWVFGTGGEMLANLTGFTDGWTEQGKEDFKETLTDLGWLLWGTVERDVQEGAKSKIRGTKRYKAFEKSMTAGIETLMDGLKLNRTISLGEALRKGNIDMKLAEELIGGKKTEGKAGEKIEGKVEGKTEKVEGKTEIKPTDKITEKPVEEIKTETKISKEEAPDTAKLTKTVIQEAFKAMVDTYRKEMGITETVKAKTDNLVNTIEQQGGNATEVKKAAEKIDNAINEISEVTAKESGIETPTTIEGVVKEMKDNFTNAVKNTEKTRAQRRAEIKLDKQLKKSGFKDEEVTTLKENRYISILNNVLENYIKEVYDTRKTIKKGKEVVEYIEREGRSKPEIQDMIFDEWYKQTAELMKKLKEGISEMDAATYRILPKTEAYNLVPLWRDWINGEGKIAEFIKRGDIEFYLDEDGGIKARYAGDMRTMDVMVESAINILNSILKEYNKATDNGRHLLSEYDILNIRDRIKPYTESKDMQTSMIGMDLMKNFNKFLDDNNMAPILRGADKVRAEYNTITELFDGILNENGEIKKQARNQMMKLDENQIQQLENLGLKGTRELLDLAKNGPGIVAHITNQLTKMVWKHPGAANVAYYGALWSTIGVLPGILGKVVGIPLGRRFGKRVQEKFFDKVPEKDVNQMFIDSLKLTDEAKAKIESDKKAVEEATSKLLQKYKEMAEKGLEASKASMAKENKGVPLTEATTITEPKTTVTDAEFVASLGELSTAIDVATERYAKTLEEETINYANNLIKELGEEGAKAKIEEELNKFKSELEKQFGEKIELPELTDEDVEIQKALDEQIANELGQEGEKIQVQPSEEGKSEAGETKAEEDMTIDEKMSKMTNKELVTQHYTWFDNEKYAQSREMTFRKTEYAKNPEKLLSDMKEALKDSALTEEEVLFYSEAADGALYYDRIDDMSQELANEISSTVKELENKQKEIVLDSKPIQKTTKAAEKNREKIIDAMGNYEKYFNIKDTAGEKKFLNIARIYEYYNGLPKELQDKVMESWLKNDYIKGNTNLYSNVSKLESALKKGLEANETSLKNYKYDDLYTGKPISSYGESTISKTKHIVTKKDVERIINRVRDFSNILNLDIPRALKEGGEGKGEMIPEFGKMVPEFRSRGRHNPWYRNISFFDNFLTGIHEIGHDITESLFFSKNPEMKEVWENAKNRKTLEKMQDKFGEEYMDGFDPTKMINWENSDGKWSIKNDRWWREYYTSPTEVISRGLMMYIAEKKGMDLNTYVEKDKSGYWSKSDYESDIKPIIERWLKDARDLFGESSDIATDKIIDELVKEGYFDNMPEMDEGGNIKEGMSVSDALMQDPLGPLSKVKEAYYRLNDAINNNETDGFDMNDIKARRDILQRARVAKIKPND